MCVSIDFLFFALIERVGLAGIIIGGYQEEYGVSGSYADSYPKKAKKIAA